MKFFLLGLLTIVCFASCSTESEIDPLFEIGKIENITILKDEGQISIHWDSISPITEYLVGMGLHYDSIWSSVKKDQALLADLPELGDEDPFVGVSKVIGDTSVVISEFVPGQTYEIYIYGIDPLSKAVEGFGSIKVETEGSALRYQGQWEKKINEASFIGWKFKKDGTCLKYSTNKKAGVEYVWEGYTQHYILNDDGSKIYLFGKKEPARQQLNFVMEEDLSILSIDDVTYTKL